MDDIMRETMSLSQIMKDFCVELYGLFNSNIDLCIELLSKYVDRYLDQFFTLDHEKLRGSFEYKLTDTIIDSTIDQIFKGLPAKTYDERISMFYKLMWVFTTSTMVTYEHNTPRGIEHQFLLFRGEMWTKHVIFKGSWDPIDIKKWTGEPDHFLTEPEEWQCNPQPLMDICMEQNYNESTIQRLFDIVLKGKPREQPAKVAKLQRFVEDSDSEDNLLLALNVIDTINDRRNTDQLDGVIADAVFYSKIRIGQPEAEKMMEIAKKYSSRDEALRLINIINDFIERNYSNATIQKLMDVIITKGIGMKRNQVDNLTTEVDHLDSEADLLEYLERKNNP